MKVALLSSSAPLVSGGYSFIVEWLERVLREHGHQVETIFLPVDERPETLFDEMLGFRLLDLAGQADRLITFRPPAHLAPHPDKIVWFIHHFRVYYDLWGTQYCPVPDTPYWRAFRNRLHRADGVGLGEARRVFANSRTVAERLRTYNGVDGEVLYPPLFAPERFRCDEIGDEIVCVCRFAAHKRQHLLIEAMRRTRTPVRLRLCGDHSEYAERLAAEAPARVRLEARWIPESRKADLLADALAVAYVPTDEDSYGYPILEGAHARKGSVTTTDGGGALEFVRHNVEGLVVEPDPDALAEAFDRLWSDRRLAARLGEAAQARIDELGVAWPRVVEKLLS